MLLVVHFPTVGVETQGEVSHVHAQVLESICLHAHPRPCPLMWVWLSCGSVVIAQLLLTKYLRGGGAT